MILSPPDWAHKVMYTRMFMCTDTVHPHYLQYDIKISAASYNIMTLYFTQCLHCEAVWETNALSESERTATVYKPSSELPSMWQTVCFALWSSP